MIFSNFLLWVNHMYLKYILQSRQQNAVLERAQCSASSTSFSYHTYSVDSKLMCITHYMCLCHLVSKTQWIPIIIFKYTYICVPVAWHVAAKREGCIILIDDNSIEMYKINRRQFNWCWPLTFYEISLHSIWRKLMCISFTKKE